MDKIRTVKELEAENAKLRKYGEDMLQRFAEELCMLEDEWKAALAQNERLMNFIRRNSVVKS